MLHKNNLKNKIKSNSKVFLILIISIILSLPVPIYGDNSNLQIDDLNYLFQTMNLVENNYFYDISKEQVLEGLLKGLFYNLDNNSNYYTKSEFQDLIGNISGDLVGIGVYLREENNRIIIDNVIKNGPADKSEIKPGDVITNINNQNIKGLNIDEVINLITGKQNSNIILGIQRKGSETLSFNILRQIIQLNPIEYSILENNTGYLKINQFTEHSYNNIVPALNELDKKNVSNLIVDLRNNPGGLLDQVIDISQLFIPEGPIVHVKYKNDIQRTHYSTLKKSKYNIVVLINGNSASASEIFAGAIQDRGVGTIIGVTSYGKGTVQQIIPLPKGDGIKLTIAEYLTPNKRNINNKGIVPDIIVTNQNNRIDEQLNKALEVLAKK